jgi:hypothetical protein
MQRNDKSIHIANDIEGSFKSQSGGAYVSTLDVNIPLSGHIH